MIYASGVLLEQVPINLTVFLLSLLFCFLIVWSSKWHGQYSLDMPQGIQRFHEAPTPRIGGLGIITALGFGVLLTQDNDTKQLLRNLFILGFFIFSFGLIEDLTKKVSVALRLWASFLPAALAYLTMELVLRSVGWASFDLLLKFSLFAIFFTAFAVGGLTHAFNLIDGFNGLSGWSSIWALAAIMMIANQVGDNSLASALTLVIAGTLGFLIFNWPLGKLFLGDGGAYLMGSCIGWSSVLLTTRNDSVFPFTLFLICVYPISEALYSIWRRKKSFQSAGQPDSAHLHQLIAVFYIYPYFKGKRVIKNSIAGFLISLFMVPPAIIAVKFYDRPSIILLAIAIFIALYIALYKALASHSHDFGQLTAHAP